MNGDREREKNSVINASLSKATESLAKTIGKIRSAEAELPLEFEIDNGDSCSVLYKTEILKCYEF